MKKETKRNFLIAIFMLLAFVFWTVAVRFVDVKPIGPNDSPVGFATINELFHQLTGVNFILYTVTDWLGLVPVFVCFGFGLLGLIQWIRRKNILKVDYSIIILGGFYITVILAYLLFEEFAINYRPVLINGYLEASYPSSTTLLVLCVMPTAFMQFNARIKNVILKRCVTIAIACFITFMIIGRLISGVHWLSDIIGGTLLSVGLVLMYHSINSLKTKTAEA